MQDGKRIRHSLDTFNDEQAATKVLEIEAGDSTVKVLVSKAVQEYMEDCESRELSDRTIDGYGRVLDSLVLFCKARAISWIGGPRYSRDQEVSQGKRRIGFLEEDLH